MKTTHELLNEAIRRGYRAGTLIDYEGMLPGTDRLGTGEMVVKGGNVIVYELPLHRDNPNFRRYDTIYQGGKWVKIVTEKHGIAL